MRIAVDLDGVIYPGGAYRDAHIFDQPPREGALEWLADLVEAGHSVLVFTSRLSQEEGHPKYKVACPMQVQDAFYDWLEEHACERARHFLLNSGLDEFDIASPSDGKIGCDIYIDDRAYRYEGGPFPTAAELERVEPYWKPKKVSLKQIPSGGKFRYNEGVWRKGSQGPSNLRCVLQTDNVGVAYLLEDTRVEVVLDE